MTRICYFFSILIATFVFSSSYAASLQVFPVNINFSQGENVKAIYVNNTGADPISAQVRVYKWTQQNETDVLTETQSLIVSPPITAIPPGKQQLLRIILPVPAGPSEQTYKLVVDELPGAADTSGKRAVRFLLRYTLPVFINTPQSVPNLSNINFYLDTHSVPEKLRIVNNGPEHLKLSNVILSSGKHQVTINQGLMGYVLAHSTRSWSLPKGRYSGSTLTFTTNDDSTTKTVPITIQ
ncbi:MULTISPECIES: fimbrial biogenesis chaperone [Tatumella]|uniref:Sigma-fimbriae chaperone protein n=1 Tax=Tatumella ptyseos ATCC 33301 TaxID=1005995 RepID=A0A085JC15_9GAMM|nr:MULTISPECIES: fimbria/pilus periplasmic chaperone [Tatumella]KFD18011.1 sigma-fimbriae chaperone protein [Tatumella ptyseos ATCC 33301]